MEIPIYKHDSVSRKTSTLTFPIKKYKILKSDPNLIIAKKGDITLPIDGSEKEYIQWELFKVQFIAHCETDFSDNDLVVAAYIGEYSALHFVVWDDLTGNYSGGNDFRIVDYSGYVELCKLTGEKQLSLFEYLKQIDSDAFGMNTLADVDDKGLNNDEVSEVWKKNDQLAQDAT